MNDVNKCYDYFYLWFILIEKEYRRKWLPTPATARTLKYNLNFIDKKFKHLSCVFYVVAPHLLAGHCDVNFTISIGWNQFNYNRIYLQTLALYNCWLLPDTRPEHRGSISRIDVWKLKLKFNISVSLLAGRAGAASNTTIYILTPLRLQLNGGNLSIIILLSIIYFLRGERSGHCQW